MDRFQISPYGLYDVKVLNSGVTLPGINIEFQPETFSFLKLHGSVAAWTIDLSGMGHPAHQTCYFETPDANQSITIGDDFFFSQPPDGQHPEHLKRPPLLYFPFQRHFIVSNDSGFAFHNYAGAVWNRAKQLVANATEIRVIGYSFSGIDRVEMLEMLETARNCRRLVIQGPDADELCNRLKLDRPKLANLIHCAPFAF